MNHQTVQVIPRNTGLKRDAAVDFIYFKTAVPTKEPVLPARKLKDNKREEETGREVAHRMMQNKPNQEEPMSSHIDVGETGGGWKRDYDPNKFVGREQELALVQDKVESGQAGVVINNPLINFWGAGGQGKTWLLKHLVNRYIYSTATTGTEEKKPTVPIYLDMENYTTTITPVIQDLSQRLKHNLKNENLSPEQQASIEKLENNGDPSQLASLIITLSRTMVILLLLDTTEAVKNQLWFELEKKFLEPILEKDRVIVVISGRRRTPRWQRVEVRRRSVPSEATLLKPFDLELLSNQLEKLSFPKSKHLAHQIFSYTSGNPALTRVLAEHIQKTATGDAYDTLKIVNLKGFDKALLEVLTDYEKDVFERVIPEYQKLILTVLPMRAYRISALRWMLQGRKDQSELPEKDVTLLRKLRTMEKETDIVWWEDKHNGYVTDPIVRRILDCKRRIAAPHYYKEQHELARKLYWQWARDYPEHSAVYLAELCFHQATLNKLRLSESAAMTDFDEIVNFVKEKLTADQGMILHARLQKDIELEVLLTPTRHKELISELDALVSDMKL